VRAADDDTHTCVPSVAQRVAINPRAAVVQALTLAEAPLRSLLSSLTHLPALADGDGSNDVAAVTAVTRGEAGCAHACCTATRSLCASSACTSHRNDHCPPTHTHTHTRTCTLTALVSVPRQAFDLLTRGARARAQDMQRQLLYTPANLAANAGVCVCMRGGG
jgi:hypothetical protein